MQISEKRVGNEVCLDLSGSFRGFSYVGTQQTACLRFLLFTVFRLYYRYEKQDRDLKCFIVTPERVNEKLKKAAQD